jgi:hypothetical protein
MWMMSTMLQNIKIQEQKRREQDGEKKNESTALAVESTEHAT